MPARQSATACFAGTSTMTMTYAYEMINGVSVGASPAVVALAH